MPAGIPAGSGAPGALLHLVRHSALAVLRRPGLLLALYALQLALAAGIWALVQPALEPFTAGRPALALADWALLLRAHPALLQRLLVVTLGALALYALAGGLLAGPVLQRLDGRRVRELGWRPGARLLLLRLAVLLASAALLGGGLLATPQLYRLAEGWSDERLHLLLPAASALLLGACLLVLLLLLHYGQPLLLRQRSWRRALGETLRLLHRRPLRCAGLYLGGWIAWVGIGILAPPGGPGGMLLAQLGVLLRLAVHLWLYAAALGVTAAADDVER